MPYRAALAVAPFFLAFVAAAPAMAAGETVITQARALAGNVTPGDTPGFPVTLSLPGAYVLESNLTVPAGTYGIFAGANNIDIDMNGFTLLGGTTATFGVISGFGESSIRGGVIKAFRYSGIYLRGNAWRIEDMKVTQNGSTGIDATGARFLAVLHTLVALNGYSGIVAGDNGAFRYNTISENGNAAIDCREGCQAESNVVDKNGNGVYFTNGMVIANTIARNLSFGIADDGAVDTGYANNMLIGNNPGDAEQVLGGVEVHPNRCIGKPC